MDAARPTIAARNTREGVTGRSFRRVVYVLSDRVLGYYETGHELLRGAQMRESANLVPAVMDTVLPDAAAPASRQPAQLRQNTTRKTCRDPTSGRHASDFACRA